MHANFFVDQWKRIEGAAFMQALEIAADFPIVSPLLVTYGFPVMPPCSHVSFVVEHKC